jgi:large subunit ribosomal protein L7/L12
LKDVGSKKIQVIKTVKEITSLGLKEAKSLVDSETKLYSFKLLKFWSDKTS